MAQPTLICNVPYSAKIWGGKYFNNGEYTKLWQSNCYFIGETLANILENAQQRIQRSMETPSYNKDRFVYIVKEPLQCEWDPSTL